MKKKRIFGILLAAVLALVSCKKEEPDRKPVIYLYPEEVTQVSVRLELAGELLCTYPEYGEGWTVEAHPDGTLKMADGRRLNYLFWEGTSDFQFDPQEGFVVAGKDTAPFLEEKLPLLGLNEREMNEFIVYWLPLMQNNPYNLIVFEGEEYTSRARLAVTPEPDTVIRVNMAWKALEKPIDIPPQKFVTPVRTGFTVVEWGGREEK